MPRRDYLNLTESTSSLRSSSSLSNYGALSSTIAEDSTAFSTLTNGNRIPAAGNTMSNAASASSSLMSSDDGGVVGGVGTLHEAHDIEAANILSSTPSSSEIWRCTAFASEQDLDDYTEHIAPHRELVCPITQELMRDPVVAEDGHTYERVAILRWFSVGRSRSPVTNAILRGHRVYPNLAVQTMAIGHRERLGAELLKRSEYIAKNAGDCDDRGARLGALLDAGADLTLREHEGHTALLYLIESAQLPLVNMLLQNDAPVNGLGDDGEEYLEAAKTAMQQALSRATQSQKHTLQQEWSQVIKDIEQKAAREKEAKESRERARTEANDE
jgi:hypothetical protein